MQITALYRHTLKSHGREALERVTLHAGQSMPYDRQWAVAHDAAKTDGTSWAPCTNFSRTSKAPRLAAINATFDDDAGTLTLTHPDRPDLTFNPDQDGAAFIEWVRPISPTDRALPARVLRLAERGFTDTPYASVSLCNAASHASVEALHNGPLSPLRWRGNIWFDGAAPWDEMEWLGRDLQLGGAKLRVRDHTIRCLATTANPETGVRDADTLAALNQLDHQNFGVYAEVIETGDIAIGDTVELL